jgi:hypothetical protein
MARKRLAANVYFKLRQKCEPRGIDKRWRDNEE